MCSSPWYYIENHVTEENARFKLLSLQYFQGYTFTREHQNIIKFKNNVAVTMFVKERHAAKVNIKKAPIL
jgi:outer membrane protein assembly factor BamE (lipoprotein component of BamABCDE complex)